MGLTKFLEKKLKGDPAQKQRNQQLKQEMDTARWEGKRKGSLERARREGYRQGKQGGSGIMGGLASIGAHIDPTGGFGGSGLDFGSSTHRKHSSSHHHGGKGKGTTIKVNGTTITVHGERNRQKIRHKRHREPEFPF
jgi:hypothetical protein